MKYKLPYPLFVTVLRSAERKLAKTKNCRRREIRESVFRGTGGRNRGVQDESASIV